ncbi:ABC transporter substrate-binding protein [Paenibacillus physcomitrellae]|uniref:ABC transporter substrate-binding protein n=1 Tax=Paenibacillus physcomitrellae TaxID=1619311 RepID=A0ABQ1GBI1_9BACL|nr:ABC transporter substrate-binding protein [Paenibacillus physcomitrellae]GGA40402.1 ABC transporter substrate-binding protein [Paenibacillus physcomitrellae]
MVRKKLAMLGLTLLMTASLTACGGGGNSGKNNASSAEPSGNASASNSASNTAQEDKTPVTFTYFNANSQVPDIDSNKTEIGKKLEEQTGVNFKLQFPVGDVNTKIGTMIASGDYPDVLAPDTAIDKILEAKAFIPLNDLIEQYGPNIKRVYGPYFNQMKQADGNIYFLPFSAVVGDYLPAPTIGQGAFFIQRRVLKEFGYPKIKTLDEYFDLIKKYNDAHKSEGLTGFTSLTYDWRTMGIFNAPMHLAGYPNDGDVTVDMATHKSNVYADDDSTKNWLKKLNEINNEGLYDKSSFVNNYDQYLAKVSSGKVLGFFDYEWEVDQAIQNIRKTGNDDLDYMPLPIVFDQNTKDQYLDPNSFVDNRGVGITTSAKDPVRIIKFFDNMLKEENQIMIQWGFKGETYEVNDQGRFYLTPEQIEARKDNATNQKVGFTYFNYSWPMYGTASTLSDGNAYAVNSQPEVAQASFTEGDRNILEKYGVRTFSELFAAPDDRPWYPAWSISIEQGSPAEIFQQKSKDVKLKYFPKLVLAKPDQFDAIWDEYLKEFGKLDVKGFESTMDELIAAKIAKVTGGAN